MDGWKMNLLLGWPIFRGYVSFRECTHPKFNSSPLKNDGWKTILFLLGRELFSGELFNFGRVNTFQIPSCHWQTAKQRCTLPETNIAPKNDGFQVRNLLFQGRIFRCYVSFRGLVNPAKIHLIMIPTLFPFEHKWGRLDLRQWHNHHELV